MRRLALALLLLGLSLPVAAEEGDPLEVLATGIEGVPGIAETFAACPADIYGPAGGGFIAFFGVAETEACLKYPDKCLLLCRNGADGESCLKIAQTLEAAGDERLKRISRMAYAMACERGQASGCTNRGGGMRNVPVAGDPWWDGPRDGIDACLFRTFTIACEGGDSWGCAMLGQSYDYGEGVGADIALAKQSYQKACTLASDPEFASCVYARQALDAISESEGGPATVPRRDE